LRDWRQQDHESLFTPAIPHLFKHSPGKGRATTSPGIPMRRFFRQRRSQLLQAGALACANKTSPVAVAWLALP
jgi:hypothetical protein